MPCPPPVTVLFRALIVAAATGLVAAGGARATPYDNIPVGDPIEAELRILDLFESPPLHRRLRLPHLDTRPLQWIELQGLGRPIEFPDPVRAVSIARIERALGRDRGPLFGPDLHYTATPRLFESNSGKTLFQVSAGVEGRVERREGDTQLISGSGFHGRVALGLDRLLAFSHYIVGRIDDAPRFADPIIPGHNIIVLTEESFISYTEEQGQWGLQFGKNRWHWGPGEEGSLVMSRTSPALTGIALRAHHDALRADGIALNATLGDAAGEQLAAHRIEWQFTDGVRVGVTEAARYKAPGWRPLYLIGIIPYVLVQRLEQQSEPDSLAALRNNVVMSIDAAWRLAEGSRVYGEVLLDDLHAASGETPNKFGYMVGWEGAGMVGGGRLSWGGEWTRISRYVYTSFFGRDYETQGKPIGFPTGPDTRRVRLRAAWDPAVEWTVFANATHSDKGENDISEPYVPGTGRVSAAAFLGVVETTREIELGGRWWPSSGVYVAVSGGYRWIDQYTHVPGRQHRTALATIAARFNR